MQSQVRSNRSSCEDPRCFKDPRCTIEFTVCSHCCSQRVHRVLQDSPVVLQAVCDASRTTVAPPARPARSSPCPMPASVPPSGPPRCRACGRRRLVQRTRMAGSDSDGGLHGATSVCRIMVELGLFGFMAVLLPRAKQRLSASRWISSLSSLC